MKTKELGQKENHGIRTSGIEDSQGNITTDRRHVLKIWENYITKCAIELIDHKTWKSNPRGSRYRSNRTFNIAQRNSRGFQPDEE